jgi:hypothetical protein
MGGKVPEDGVQDGGGDRSGHGCLGGWGWGAG